MHRLRKLESEIQAKDSRIHLLEQDVADGVKALEGARFEAADRAEMSQIAFKQLEASLEVKVHISWFYMSTTYDVT